MDPFLTDRRLPHNSFTRVYVEVMRHVGVEPIVLPAWWLAEKSGVDRNEVARHLNTLVANGYLIEHPTQKHRPRRFSLPAAQAA